MSREEPSRRFSLKLASGALGVALFALTLWNAPAVSWGSDHPDSSRRSSDICSSHGKMGPALPAFAHGKIGGLVHQHGVSTFIAPALWQFYAPARQSAALIPTGWDESAAARSLSILPRAPPLR